MHRSKRWFMTQFMIAWCVLPAGAQQAPDALPPEVIAKVNSLISGAMSRAKIPGLSLAIVTDLQLRWQKGFGQADLENSVPATPNTSYRLASITKSITAAAIMQLVEQGKLDLDAPIQRYAPTFPQKPWPVTARRLLTHTGGIRTYKAGEMENTRFFPTLTDALTVFKDDPLDYQPGTKYIYSSEGYTLLAVAVEGASGMKYFDYVRNYIFEPAGMTDSRPDSVTALIPHRTQGYKKLASGELVNSELADTSSKAVVCSTVGDLAKFAVAFLSGKLVKPETVAEMFKVDPVTERHLSNGSMGYGFGWNVMPAHDDQDLQAFKAGNQQRVTGLLYMRPQRKCIVVMLCNLEDAPLTAKLAHEISDTVTGPPPSASR